MSRASLFACIAIAGSLRLLSAADLAGVHSVYILQMPHGMDQYLANRLTNAHVFRVVTDPKAADAVVTAQIGEDFEQELDTLLPPPEPVKKAPPAEKEKDKDKPAGPLLLIDSDAKLPRVRSTFGAGRGTVFLVDPKSHQVLWSVYEPPKASDSKELDRTASVIVDRLKKDLGLKK